LGTIFDRQCAQIVPELCPSYPLLNVPVLCPAMAAMAAMSAMAAANRQTIQKLNGHHGF
jgi:hypothetical protein